MPIFKVPGADGRSYTVEAPDEQSAIEEVNRVTTGRRPQDIGQPIQQDPRGFWERVGGAAKATGTGLVRGATEMAMLPHTIERLGRGAVGAGLEGIFGPGRGQPPAGVAADQAQDAMRAKRESLVYQPQDGGESMLAMGGEFALGGLPGAVGRGIRAVPGAVVRQGIIPGLASEGAGQYFKGEEMEVPARIAGALLGGMTGAAMSRPRTAAQALQANLPRGITPKNVDAAEALMRSAQYRGVPVTLAEALHKVTNGRVDIRDIQRWVEQSPRGRQVMSEFMGQRPGQMQMAVDEGMDALTYGARMTDPVRAGMTIQNVSQQALTRIRQRINATTEKLYTQSANSQVPPIAFGVLYKDPAFQAALRAVRSDPVHSATVAGLTDDSVGVLNEIKKWFDRQSGTARVSGDNTAAGFYGARAERTRSAASAADPAYARALEQQARLRQNILAPAEEGPLGRMAGTADLGQQSRSLLERSPLEGSQAVVAQTMRRLVRSNPNAAFQMVRSHIRRVADETMRQPAGGPDQWAGGKFVAAIRGNSQQAKNLEAAVRALPDGNMRWDGVNEMLDILDTTGRRLRPGSPTEANRLMTEQMSRGPVVGEMASVAASPGSTLTFIRDRYQTWRRGLNSEQFADLIIEPDSAALLRQLVNAKSLSEKQRLAAILMYQGLQMQAGQMGVGERAPAPVQPALQ